MADLPIKLVYCFNFDMFSQRAEMIHDRVVNRYRPIMKVVATEECIPISDTLPNGFHT